MVDIAPGLLEKIERAFNETINNSARLRELADELTYGSGQYGEAEELACIVGDALSDAIMECLSEDVLPDGRLYENIAQKIIPPSLRRNYDIISEYARKAQENVNRVGGIGIKPIVPEYSVDREQGIIRHAVNGKTYDAHARSFLDEVVTFGQKVVDDSIQQNAGFQYRAGLGAKITRTVHGKACKWCMNLAGVYDYGDMPDDIFRRHANCRCVVEYKVGKWSQNVHTKQYYDENGNAIDARKVVGLSTAWHKNLNNDIISTQKSKRITLDLQFFSNIAREKFTEYALNESAEPNKAKAFREALGFTKDNCDNLIKQINHNVNFEKCKSKGRNDYGELFEQVMEVVGVNGKKANVCTGWIKKNGEDELSLTSVYVTKKKVSE